MGYIIEHTEALPPKPVVEKINVENVVRKDDSFEKLAEKCLKSTPKGKPVNKINEVDDKLLDRIKTKSYLYQDKSQKKGDGLKTTPWSDMVNKEQLFKLIDEMESGQNMYELEKLL